MLQFNILTASSGGESDGVHRQQDDLDGPYRSELTHGSLPSLSGNDLRLVNVQEDPQRRTAKKQIRSIAMDANVDSTWCIKVPLC